MREPYTKSIEEIGRQVLQEMSERNSRYKYMCLCCHKYGHKSRDCYRNKNYEDYEYKSRESYRNKKYEDYSYENNDEVGKSSLGRLRNYLYKKINEVTERWKDKQYERNNRMYNDTYYWK